MLVLMKATRSGAATDRLQALYRSSLALLTDLYQLTMAQGYWKTGIGQREAVFSLFFRHNPFEGGYTLAAGLESVIDYLNGFRFTSDDLEYLAEVPGNDGKPLFSPDFLEALAQVRLGCDLDAVPEGTVVFAHEPMVRVRGPLLECQLLETPLLTLLNFPTLIATKATRVCRAAQGMPVLEFGLRRAQGIDGGLTASRAAYLGGCAGTSNVLAGKMYGIPIKGTHAHSWVMSFPDERAAFQAYAEAMPNNCVFLVDTYDSVQGVRRAVEVGKWLRRQGHEMIGVRLDSGDLAKLSIEARKILDESGFAEASIVASNNLDEYVITSLIDQNAAIDVWGVGTRLATAYQQPALGGVYKLSAIRDDGGRWQPKIKLSEQAIKVNNPGIPQVRRFFRDGAMVADMIFDEEHGIEDPPTLIDLLDVTAVTTLPADAVHQDLLTPVFRQGRQVYTPPPLEESRRFARSQLDSLDPGVKRFLNPAFYSVGLERGLDELKRRLIVEARHTQGR